MNADFTHFGLSESERSLVLRAVPNEVLRGFRVPDFLEQIGLSESEYEALMARLEDGQIQLDRPNATFIYNALRVVLTELGEDEFQTRTGFDFPHGRALLNRLSEALDRSERDGAK